MHFEYRRAENIEEALRFISEGRSMFIAGGTDILVNIKNGSACPSTLVDIGDIEELKQITELDSSIEIGALLTYAQAAGSEILRNSVPVLVDACCAVGSPQIRARGTIGGNLITASPSGDTIPALFSLDAMVKLRSSEGEREVPIQDFFVDVKKTVIEPEELLVSVKVEKPVKGTKFYFAKLGQRNALAISKATVALCMRLGGNLAVEDARIALGAVAKTVIRAPRTEKHLAQKKLDSVCISEAESIVQSESMAIDDIRSTSSYRNRMVGVLLARGLRVLAGQVQ